MKHFFTAWLASRTSLCIIGYIETPDDNAQLLAKVKQLEVENQLLRQKLDALSKRLFGTSSEKLDPNQLELLMEELEAPKKPEASSNDETSEQEEAAAAKRKKTKGKNHSRIKGLSDLEVEERIELPDEYQANPEAFEIIGQEVTELLDYRPARCVRQITKRVKVRRKDEPSQAPLLAPAPATPLIGGLPSFNLVTELIIGKYADHLPLYRQQNIFQRCGLYIPRDTLNHWTLSSLELLQPIAQAIHEETLGSDYLQGDETPLRLLAPGTGKTTTSYFWVFNAPSGSLSYRWASGRSTQDLIKTLGTDYQGVLQCDGYRAYNKYQKENSGVILGSCMAHIRRKFHEALEAGERHAAHIIRAIGHLYQLEDKLRKQRAGPALRDAIRASQSRPILKRLHKILINLRPRVRPQSLMGRAITYALGEWTGLDAYLLDGRVELDNNLIENAIRPTKLGQKNWLFLGSERGGELAAVAFTLIENCKRNGIDLRRYLAETMKALVEQGPASAPSLTPRALTTHPRRTAA